MRKPGFEPGSSAWKAEVLNQVELLTHKDKDLKMLYKTCSLREIRKVFGKKR